MVVTLMHIAFKLCKYYNKGEFITLISVSRKILISNYALKLITMQLFMRVNKQLNIYRWIKSQQYKFCRNI